MTTNEIIVKVRVDDSGQLKVIANEATKAGGALNGVGKSARTADRNLKGAAQASANGTKNFSKMAQGLTGGLVPAYAAVAAQVFALTALFNFLKNAADFENLKAAQTSYANSTGVALKSVSKQIQDASKNMLGFKEAAQAAAIGAAKGFTASQMTEMAAGAGKAAQALGRSYEDTFDRLIRGVSKAEPELLDELGITLRLEKATKDYAAAIGTQADKLTAAQRSQAVYLETMRQLNNNFGAVEAQGNVFVQLSKTFEEIGQTVTKALLPAFEGIAKFLNENAKAAAIAFGALIAMVLLNISGLKDGVFNIFKGIISATTSTATSIGSGLGKGFSMMLSGASAVVDKVEEMEKGIKTAAQAQQEVTGKAAKSLIEGGAGSKTLEKLSMGVEISPQAKGKLLADLDRIEKEILETGETTSKAFAGATLDGIRKLRVEVEKTGKTSLSTGKKIQKYFGKGLVFTLKSARVAAKGLALGFRGVATAATYAAKGIALMAKASVIIGIIGQIINAFDRLSEAPASSIKAFISFVSKIAKGIQMFLNFIVDGINGLAQKLPDWAKERLGIAKGEALITKFTFADDAEAKLTALANTALEKVGVEGGLDTLEKVEAENKAAAETKQRIDDLKQSYIELGTEAKTITEGIRKQNDEFARTGQITNAIATLPLAGAMKAAIDNPELKGAFQALIDSIDLDAMGTKFAAAVRSGDIETVEALQTAAASYNASKSTLKDTLDNLGTTLQAGDPLGARLLVESMIAMATEGDKAAQVLGVNGGLAKVLDEDLGQSAQDLLNKLQAIEDKLSQLSGAEHALAMARQKSQQLPTVTRAETELQNKVEEERLALERKQETLKQMNLETANLTEKERVQHEQNITGLEREIELQKLKYEQAQENLSITGRIGQTAMQSLETGMVNALTGITEGTKSVKQAFADMAMMVLQEINRLIIRMLVARLILAAFNFGGGSIGAEVGMTDMPMTDFSGYARDGGMFGANGKKMEGYRYGGIAQLAGGGVMSGPNAGYPVMMHGAEAVVPLPDGKAIPVDMKGSGQQNNVVVNVNMDRNGNATTTTESQQGADMGALGAAIARAVQQELHNQKRSGGILSPYGVA